MAPTIDLRRLPSVSNPAFYPLHRDRSRNLVLMGGGGSGKSFFVAQKIVVRAMREPASHIVAFRKVHRTVKTSTWAQLREVIRQLGVQALWREHGTDLTLTFLPNGSVLRCTGMDDPEKLKSIVGMTSAWLEEATEFTQGDYEQINLRLRGLRPQYKQIILSFNPVSVMHWLKRRFFDTPQANSTVVVTTYRDNAFIDDEYAQELQLLKERDPELGAIYADGQWGSLTGLVYRAWPNGERPTAVDETIYGLDFGFNAPMALVQGDLIHGAAPTDAQVWLNELLYQTHLTTEGLIAMLPSLGVPQDRPIYCDAAEPDRIQALCDAGWWALPAKKGADSVRAGIDLVKSLDMHTRPDNVNLNKELATYKWAVDKDGNPMDQPVKFADHLLDATRYMLHSHLSGMAAGAFAAGGLDVRPD